MSIEPNSHSSTDTTAVENDGVVLCPRCQEPLFDGQDPARFYGPCQKCRQQLRQDIQGEATEAAAVEYEPKMNVTPNAVALKDD